MILHPDDLARILGYAPAGAVSSKPAAKDDHPVNPYSLAWLMTGKKPETDADVVAAFGMPWEKILAVGGPLYSPDLAAIAKRAQRTLPAGAAAKMAPDAKFADTLVQIAPRVGEFIATMPRPGAPAAPSAPKTSADPNDPLGTLARGGVDCAAWNAMSDIARQNTVVNFGLATHETSNSVVLAVNLLCPTSNATVSPIRGGTASAPVSLRGVMDPDVLLRAMGITPAQWVDYPCSWQFQALSRVTGESCDAFRDRGTLWQQWLAIYSRYGGGIGSDEWYYWVRRGGYASQRPSVGDPNQGNLGDCFFVASLASTAWVRPDIIAAGNWRGGAPIPLSGTAPITITLRHPVTGSDVPITMSGRIPIALNWENLCDSGNVFCRGDWNDQSWSSLYEKAFAIWSGRVTNDRPRYSPSSFLVGTFHPAGIIAGGNGTTVMQSNPTVLAGLSELAGWRNTAWTADAIWNYLGDHCDASGKASSVLIAGTRADVLERGPTLVPMHAYSVLGRTTIAGRRFVVMRNPWGHRGPGTSVGEWMGLRYGVFGIGLVAIEDVANQFGMISGNWYGTRKANDFGSDAPWYITHEYT